MEGTLGSGEVESCPGAREWYSCIRGDLVGLGELVFEEG
jgi:hypothetical protein